MTKRSPAAVLILSLLTLGIYHIIWLVKTKGEMVRVGATIPTAWLIIVPIANLYWMWKWSQGVEHVTRGKSGAGITFVMLLLVNQFFFIGSAIIQGSLNTAIDQGGAAQLPQARVA
jgi:Domain of unknown function (DUF4234)